MANQFESYDSGAARQTTPRERGSAGGGLAAGAVTLLETILTDVADSSIGLSEPGQLALQVGDFLAEPDPLRSLKLYCGEVDVDLSVEWVQSAIRRVEHDIALIDEIVQEQLNAILHHPQFQELESSWRGLDWLCERHRDCRDQIAHGGRTPNLQLWILNTSKKELAEDLENAPDFDQSACFKKIYEERFGTFGGEPWGLLLGDFEFTNHPDDVALLRNMSSVAAAAFVPFVSAAAPELLGIDHFGELEQPVIDVAAVFQQRSWIPWNSLREHPSGDTRFTGLVMPRILMRLPYRLDGTGYCRPDHHYSAPAGLEQRISYASGFRFNEQVHRDDNDPDESDLYLWGNAAYAFGAVVLQSFASSGWFADIRGFERNSKGGGLVESLPVDSYSTDSRNVAIKSAVEVVITQDRERQLSDLGFIPLCACQDTAAAAFFTSQSIQKPTAYSEQVDATNAKISAMLQYILCASRFAHYVKAITHRHLGKTSVSELQAEVNDWLANYVNAPSRTTPARVRAERPLRAARVALEEVRGASGRYKMELQLQPHYQLDEILGTLRLQTQISSI